MQKEHNLTERDFQIDWKNDKKKEVSQINTHKNHRSNLSYLKENKRSFIIKQVPSDHYIESRFLAYNQAKMYNKPLFSDISKNQGELTGKSSSVSRFRSSRIPQVPLTQEFLIKVQKINNFRESFSCKRPGKKEVVSRTESKVENKLEKKNPILLSLKTWDSLKKECLKNQEIDIYQTKTILLEKRLKKSLVLREDNGIKPSPRNLEMLCL